MRLQVSPLLFPVSFVKGSWLNPALGISYLEPKTQNQNLRNKILILSLKKAKKSVCIWNPVGYFGWIGHFWGWILVSGFLTWNVLIFFLLIFSFFLQIFSAVFSRLLYTLMDQSDFLFVFRIRFLWTESGWGNQAGQPITRGTQTHAFKSVLAFRKSCRKMLQKHDDSCKFGCMFQSHAVKR